MIHGLGNNVKRGAEFMWIYEKRLQYPVDVKCRDLRMAKAIYEELGGELTEN